MESEQSFVSQTVDSTVYIKEGDFIQRLCEFYPALALTDADDARFLQIAHHITDDHRICSDAACEKAAGNLFAVLKKLELVCDDTENAVSYSFEFVGCRKNNADGLRRVIFGDDESTLWDYSFRFGLNIDTLVRLNPHIRRPDTEIKCSERINLC